jgi:hypothetical protein
MIEDDQLERLLHDIAGDRAGGPVAAPDDALLGDLRSRGRARRRRRSRQLITVAVTVILGGLLALSRLTASDRDPGQVDLVDEPSTTTTTDGSTSTTATSTTSTTTTSTTPPTSSTESAGSTTLGPASGMPASTYVGLDVTASAADGTGLATSAGQPLGYLSVQGHQAGPGGRTIVQLDDTGGTMVWLLTPGWPADSTVLDAVEVPLSAPAQLGTGCTADTDAPVFALVETGTTDEADAVVGAWTIAADGSSLEPIPAATPVTCTG